MKLAWTTALLLATFATAARADGPAADDVAVSLSGLSCLANPGDAALDETGTKLTLEFNNVLASADGGIAARRAICSSFVTVDAPRGWTYRVKAARYLHNTILPQGGARTTRTSFHFQGQAATLGQATTLSGPVEARGWTTVHASLPDDASAYAPCAAARALVFMPTIEVTDARGGSGELLNAELELEWKRCD